MSQGNADVDDVATLLGNNASLTKVKVREPNAVRLTEPNAVRLTDDLVIIPSGATNPVAHDFVADTPRLLRVSRKHKISTDFFLSACCMLFAFALAVAAGIEIRHGLDSSNEVGGRALRSARVASQTQIKNADGTTDPAFSLTYIVNDFQGQAVVAQNELPQSSVGDHVVISYDRGDINNARVEPNSEIFEWSGAIALAIAAVAAISLAYVLSLTD